MIDAYRIGVSMVMTNSISAVLHVIQRDLLGLKRTVDLTQGGFDRLKLAALGAGAIAGGAAVLGILYKMQDAGKELVNQQKMLTTQGLTQKDVAAATATAWDITGKVIGSRVEDNLRAIGELRSVLGNTEEAMKFAPNFVKLGMTLQMETGRSSEGAAYTAAKAMELRGATIDPVTHEISPERLNQQLELMMKAVAATHGKVGPEEFLAFMKRAGPAGRAMDDESMYGVMPTIIQAMSGFGAGTALTAVNRQLVGGIMPQRVASEMEKLKLIDAKGVHVKRGGQVTVDQGSIHGSDLASKDLFQYVNTILVPAMEKAGFKTDEQKMKELYRLFGTETARRMVAELIQNKAQIAKDIVNVNQSQGLGAFDTLMATHGMEAFLSAIHNVMAALGAPMVEPINQMLISLARHINDLAMWAKDNPDTVLKIEKWTAAVAAFLVAAGSLSLAIAAFTPLAAAMMGLARLMSGASLAAATTGAASFAGAVGLVANALLAAYLLYQGTKISQTQSAQDDRAPYGGKSLHERFPGLIVRKEVPLGPTDGSPDRPYTPPPRPTGLPNLGVLNNAPIGWNLTHPGQTWAPPAGAPASPPRTEMPAGAPPPEHHAMDRTGRSGSVPNELGTQTNPMHVVPIPPADVHPPPGDRSNPALVIVQNLADIVAASIKGAMSQLESAASAPKTGPTNPNVRLGPLMPGVPSVYLSP